MKKLLLVLLLFCFSGPLAAQDGSNFRMVASQIAFAWNTQDTTLLKSFYADQFFRVQSFDTTSNKKDLVKSYLNTTGIIKNTTISLALHEAVTTENKIIVPFIISGLSDVKFCGESVPDAPVQYHGMQALTFYNGQVIVEKLYYDRLPLLNNICTNIFNKSGPVVEEDPD